MILEVQRALLIFPQFPLDDVAERLTPAHGPIAQLGHLALAIFLQVLPVCFGQGFNRFQQRCGLVGGNPENHLVLQTKPYHVPTVKTAVRAQFFGQITRHAFQRLGQKPNRLANGVSIAPPQMTEDQFADLLPKCQQRMVADFAIVSLGRALLAGGRLLIHTRIQIQRATRHCLLQANALLHALVHPAQVMNVANVKLPQELSRRRRRENVGDFQQRLCSSIAAQDFQVQQALAPHDQVVDQTHDRLALTIAAFAPLNFQLFIQNVIHPQRFSKLVQQHHPGVTAQTDFFKTEVELPNFADYTVFAHLLSASWLLKWCSRKPHFYTVGGFFSIHSPRLTRGSRLLLNLSISRRIIRRLFCTLPRGKSHFIENSASNAWRLQWQYSKTRFKPWRMVYLLMNHDPSDSFRILKSQMCIKGSAGLYSCLPLLDERCLRPKPLLPATRALTLPENVARNPAIGTPINTASMLTP